MKFVLSILGNRTDAYCDGLSRRQFLHIGALGLGGLSLPSLLQAQETATSRDHSVVMIYLPGGPTQFETFDPKPDAPVEIRGAFGTIPTKTPGVSFCELLPKLAGMSDQFSIIRSLVGMQDRHESFQCYAGKVGGPENNEPVGGWPTFGSVVSRLKGPGANGAAPYVDASSPMAYGPYRNRGLHIGSNRPSWPGFTGQAHVPFALDGEVKSNLVLNGVDLSRLGDRRALLSALDLCQRQADDGGLGVFQQQAFDLLTASKLAEALDLSKEPAAVRERYGEVQKTYAGFGGAPQDPQQLLLTRRLVEAGVRCVTLAFGAWDWHANREGPIDQLSQKYLPVFDHALSVFLQDLDERGLLATTTVVVWGEFGRSPRINPKGGRDHWPSVQSVLLAGGGIQGGRIVGETDRIGGVPAARPVDMQEVFATLYHVLGIDANAATLPDLNGRPRYLVDDNFQRISELL